MTAHGVGIAAAVQHEVLVLHVVERLRIEGHADEVEIRIEAVDLDRIFDVVVGRAVAVVVGVAVLGGGHSDEPYPTPPDGSRTGWSAAA